MESTLKNTTLKTTVYWTITALILHLAVGDSPEAWGWAAVTDVLWPLSYVLWRQRG
jgi:hypothetical protein